MPAAGRVTAGKPMKCLHLKFRGGLANRLRVWASAVWTAERYGFDVVSSWGDRHFMPARWDELFRNTLADPAPGLENLSTVRFEHPTYLDLSDPEIQRAEVVELTTCEAFSTDPDIKALSYDFWAEVRPYLLALDPVPEVTALVDSVTSTFGPAVLGCHVRLGAGALMFNPTSMTRLESFFEEIDRQLAEDPSLQLYVATDTDALVAKFQERYGSALITLDEFVEPPFRVVESERDIRIAMAEMLILARTHKLLGTYQSSFGALAGAVGALPYMEIGKPSGGWRWKKFREGT